MQGFFDNELNFNKDDSCKKSCSDYTKAENVACTQDTMCSKADENREKTICSGEIRDCENSEFDNEVEVCYSSRPDRRYEHVRFSNDQIYGLDITNSSSCSNKLKVKIQFIW